FTEPETAPLLLANWRADTPALRSEIVLAMLGGRSRLLPLLQAIQDGVIPANQVPFARRAVLLRSADAQVKELATKLFSDAAPGARRTLAGIIPEESAARPNLKRAEGVTETVLRRDIAELSGSGLSLMPEGLETAVTVEQMADLIAFLLPPR